MSSETFANVSCLCQDHSQFDFALEIGIEILANFFKVGNFASIDFC